MEPSLTDLLGYAAAGLVLATFSVRSITALRSVAIASNLLLLIFALFAHALAPEARRRIGTRVWMGLANRHRRPGGRLHHEGRRSTRARTSTSPRRLLPRPTR